MPLEETIVQAIVQEIMATLKPLLVRESKNRVISGDELAEQLRVSKKTLERMRQDGLMAYKPYGAKYYYFEKDVENYIKKKGRAI